MMIIIRLIWLISVGCSFKQAARHVWYDRFERESPLFSNTWEIQHARWLAINETTDSANIGLDDTEDKCQSNSRTSTITTDRCTQTQDLEIGSVNEGGTPIFEQYRGYPGSSIDRAWRLSMASFIVGALPQAIKVFGMRGIPFTQTLVAFLLASFSIPEILRMIVGSAGVITLPSTPAVTRTKKTLLDVDFYALSISIMFTCISISYTVFVPLFNGSTSHSSYPDLTSLVRGIIAVYTVTVGLTLHIALAISGMEFTSRAMTRVGKWLNTIMPACICETWASWRSSFGTLVSTYLAYDPPLSPSSFELTIFFVLFNVAHTTALFYVLSGDEPRFPVPNLRHISPGLIVYAMSYVIIGIPAFLLIPYLVYRLLFMGPLSRTPRRIFGLEGSNSEFCSGAFVMMNFLSSLMGYSFLWFDFGDANDTYKPSWADALG